MERYAAGGTANCIKKSGMPSRHTGQFSACSAPLDDVGFQAFLWDPPSAFADPESFEGTASQQFVNSVAAAHKNFTNIRNG